MNLVLSTIDLGTNTVLMVTGEKMPSGEIRILGDEHAIGRLGKGVDAEGSISPDTFDRIAEIMIRYRGIAEGYGARQIVAYGTSALRDAANRDEFIAAMLERTGIELRLLSGEDEAELTWRGALFGLPLDAAHIAALDIGGGSTEIAYGSNGRFGQGVSVDVGAVRVTERFFRSVLPPDRSAVADARSFAQEKFHNAILLPTNSAVVGVAGTVTTLGAMQAGVDRFDAEAINGRELTRDWIEETAERLLTLSLDDLLKIPQVAHGREDILPGGALILAEFMKAFDVPGITVSTRGLRYGLLWRELDALS